MVGLKKYVARLRHAVLVRDNRQAVAHICERAKEGYWAMNKYAQVVMEPLRLLQLSESVYVTSSSSPL